VNFTPNDLQNIMFRKSVFGYNALQVDDVLEKVVEDLAELIRDNARLKDKLDDVQGRLDYYKGIEKSLQNSLIVAQQTSDEIISNARKSAENIIKEAELQAKQIIEQANSEVLSIRYEQERVKRDIETYKTKLETIIRAQLRSLQNLDEPSETLNYKAV